MLSPEQYEEGLLEACSSASKRDSQVSRTAKMFAIKQVVELMKTGAPATQGQAARALERLAAEDPDYRARVVEANAIPVLVDLLDPRTSIVEEHAARALSRLARQCPRHRALVASAGAIPALTDLLLPPASLVVRMAAAEALLHLARNSTSNKAMIVLAGAIPPLIDLLAEDSSLEAPELAMAVLGSLGASNTGHEERIRQAAGAAGYYLDDLNLIEEPVILHIYDVSADSRVHRVNNFFRPVGTGAFHAGVEIYGTEWSYGCRDDRGTGVFSCEPGRNPCHNYREAVPMDVTTLSKCKVLEILQKMEKAWLGRDYHLISHNCCHFCEVLSEALGVGPPPAWVTNLASTGASLVSGVQTAVATAQAVREEVDQRLHVCNLAESAVRSVLGAPQKEAIRSVRTSRVLARVRSREGEELARGKPDQQVLCPAGDFGFGDFAQKLLPGIWCHDKDARGSSVDVLLECVRADGVDLAQMSRWRRCLARRLQEGEAWPIGPLHQPQTFHHLIPDASKLPEEHRTHDALFEIAWQSPCLYLRKPVLETPILVKGAPVRHLTYVLLQNVEIELSDPSRGSPCLSFRILRDAAAKQAGAGLPQAGEM